MIVKIERFKKPEFLLIGIKKKIPQSVDRSTTQDVENLEPLQSTFYRLPDNLDFVSPETPLTTDFKALFIQQLEKLVGPSPREKRVAAGSIQGGYRNGQLQAHRVIRESQDGMFGLTDVQPYLDKEVEAGEEIAVIVLDWMTDSGLNFIPTKRSDSTYTSPVIGGLINSINLYELAQIACNSKDPKLINPAAELITNTLEEIIRWCSYIHHNATESQISCLVNYHDSKRMVFYKKLMNLNPRFPSMDELGGLDNIAFSLDMMKRFGIKDKTEAIDFINSYNFIQKTKADLIKTDYIVDLDTTLDNYFIGGTTYNVDGSIELSSHVSFFKGDNESSKIGLWARLPIKHELYGIEIFYPIIHTAQKLLASIYGRYSNGKYTKEGKLAITISGYEWHLGRALWEITRKACKAENTEDFMSSIRRSYHHLNLAQIYFNGIRNILLTNQEEESMQITNANELLLSKYEENRDGAFNKINIPYR